MSGTDVLSPPRHILWYRFVAFVLKHTAVPIGRRKLDVHAEKIDGTMKKPYVVMYNHVSDFDAIVTIIASPVHNRYVMSDRLIRTLPKRIFFKLLTDGMYRTKGKNADMIKRSCKMTIDRGICVYMSPEGEESVDGCSHPIRGGTGQLVKDLECPMITYRITGTYFSKPPYAKNSAKGPKFGEKIREYTKEELAEMSPDEINEAISRDLYVNHYDWMKEKRIKYVREAPAEHMDFLLYICPSCRSEGNMVSENDTLSCKSCGYSVKVNDYGLFESDNTIFDNLYDWYSWQEKEFEKNMKKAIEEGKPIATTDSMELSVKDGEGVKHLEDGVTITLSADGVTIKGDKTDMAYGIDDIISISVPSSNGINVFTKDGYYVLKSTKNDCTRRYRTLFKLIKKHRSEHP